MTLRFISLLFLSISLVSCITIDPKSIDILLREIRARLQEKNEQLNVKIVSKGAEDLLTIDEDGSGSGSGSDEDDEEVSKVTGVPLLADNDVIEKVAKTDEKFPSPDPIFDKRGVLKNKEEIEKVTLENMKKQAPVTIQEHYKQNPKATMQMLQGLDIHGASGGYHRALSGGYLSPSSYDPYNVNWHSYGEKGIKQKEDATKVFRRIFLSP